MESVTYFTKPLLKKVNNQSIKADRNRTIIPQVIDELDDDTLFPVVFAMPHNDVEMRLRVMLAPESGAFLDVSFEAYEELPTTTLTTELH